MQNAELESLVVMSRDAFDGDAPEKRVEVWCLLGSSIGAWLFAPAGKVDA
jgi:hypothetical protein